jgi:hypothetical protein
MDKQMTMEQIKNAGLNILYKKLGTVNYIKFIQQFSNGYGDFTKERKKFADSKDIDTLIQDIKARRKK